MNSTRKQVAVVVGATSKWQADGHNTAIFQAGARSVYAMIDAL